MAYIDINDTTGAGGGDATAANQLVEIALLTSIDSKEATFGQKPMSGSEPVVIASDQSPIDVKVIGSLVPEHYDQIDLTYIIAGNGTGQIGVVVYKLLTVTIATLTLTYNASSQVISIVRS